MRCRVCGSNNEDGSKFCWNCGNKLTEQSETRSSSVNQPGIQQNSGDVQHNQVGTPPKQVRMPQRQVPPGGFDWENGKKMAEERLQKGKNIADGCVGQLKRVAENQTITDKLKKISKKTWGIIGACVALVLVLLIVIALHKPTVNLNDYLKVTYGGYDGGGVAYTEIDWNSMKEDFENKISYKRGMAQTGGMTPIDIIMEYTNANIEGKNEKLSNGDKVSYTWKVDKDAIAKLIKCKIKYSDGSKKVSGLKEMELFDPFKNLKVTFSGVEPNGEADIEYNGDMLSEYDFTCDKTSGLKNGDKIKISLTEDAGYYVDQYNKAPSVLEKLEAVDLGVTSDYLCSYSSDRLLTDSDVEGYLNANYSEYNFPEGINIIQMIINEIYAKHGYEFTDSKLSAYFSNKTWYKSNTNKVNDMNAVSDSMSEIEKKNVDFLNSYR